MVECSSEGCNGRCDYIEASRCKTVEVVRVVVSRNSPVTVRVFGSSFPKIVVTGLLERLDLSYNRQNYNRKREKMAEIERGIHGDKEKDGDDLCTKLFLTPAPLETYGALIKDNPF
jgi:hypothetical protein